MNIFLYIIIWIIGTLFGSFFTLSVYRIPKGEDITHKRSYCPQCNHKLGFFDLIPIMSYIFLRGKCRYCEKPIHKRYILFEFFTGLVFVIIALSLGLNIYSSVGVFIKYLYEILIISILMILGLIDKERNVINLTVILFGILFRTIYLVLYEFNLFSQYFIPTALVYIIFSLFLACVHNSKDIQKDKIYNTIMYFILLIFVLGIDISCLITILGLIYVLIKRFVIKKDIFLIYFLSILTIITLLILNFSQIRNILILVRGIL